MNTFRLGLLVLQCVGFLQLSGCSAEDAAQSTAVTAGKRLHTPDSQTKMDKPLLESYEDISAEYKDEYPNVAFSAKPRNSSVTARKGKGKDRERKKNLCLRKRFRNYCVHGVCQYLAELNRTSCICDVGYSGDRCHLFILPVGKEVEGNRHTTALAVMAVVLSLICLTIIGILLALRCPKKSESCVEEKIRLQPMKRNEGKANHLIHTRATNQGIGRQDGYHLETSFQR